MRAARSIVLLLPASYDAVFNINILSFGGMKIILAMAINPLLMDSKTADAFIYFVRISPCFRHKISWHTE